MLELLVYTTRTVKLKGMNVAIRNVALEWRSRTLLLYVYFEEPYYSNIYERFLRKQRTINSFVRCSKLNGIFPLSGLLLKG